MLRFHLDENVDHAIAVGLRSRGLDVTTTEDVGLKGASDENQLAYALREDRVIVTHDNNLLVLASQGTPHAGIGYSSHRTRTIGQLVLKLAALSRHFEPSDMVGRLEFL